MNDLEVDLYRSLARAFGDKVIDPDYVPPHKQRAKIEQLKVWTRENWSHRRSFPLWVDKWIARFTAEGKASPTPGVDPDHRGTAEAEDAGQDLSSRSEGF